MDRNYTIFDKWRTFVNPLGTKHARVQAGWARCEPVPGQYQWDWLDSIVYGLNASGNAAWLQVSYGNPAYVGGGTPEASSPLPSGAAALNAWAAWVTALVTRYSEIVSTFEIWNEPNCQNISADDFAIFTQSTAAVIKSARSDASVRFGVLCGVDTHYASDLLLALNHSGGVKLVDTLTYHPYAYNPDSVYASVEELASIVKSFAPHVTLAQGENGAPSVGGGYGALVDYNWTECSQAKWFLRRLLADGARSLPSNAFTMADLCYVVNGKIDVNHKGLLETNCSDKSIVRPKLAYSAVQRVTSVFTDALLPASVVYPTGNIDVVIGGSTSCSGSADTATLSDDSVVSSYVWAAADGSGQLAIALWQNSSTPSNAGLLNASFLSVNISVSLAAMPGSAVHLQAYDYVGVDMLTGTVFSLPSAEPVSYLQHAPRVQLGFTGVPVSDWPVLIVSKTMIMFSSSSAVAH